MCASSAEIRSPLAAFPVAFSFLRDYNELLNYAGGFPPADPITPPAPPAGLGKEASL